MADEPAMPAPTGESLWVTDVHAVGFEELEDAPEEAKLGTARELRPVADIDHLARILRSDVQPTIRTRGQPTIRAQRDCHVQGLRTRVVQVQRPDVDGGAGQVDPRRR